MILARQAMEAHKAASVGRVKLHEGHLISVAFPADSESVCPEETDLRDIGVTKIDGGT